MRFLVALTFVFLSWSSLLAQSNYQLLWEITAPKGLKSYVFGSMHSNDPRVFNFPDSLYYAFEQSSTLVLETDITPLFDQLDVRIDGFALELARGKQPLQGGIEATLTTYGSEDGRPQFLDVYFQQTAFIAGKKIIPLETINEQIAASESIQKMAEKQTFGLRYNQDAFVNSYLAGDISTLTYMLKKQLESIPGAYDRLINQRNVNMTKGLDTLMRKQNVFCVVGSGHLFGQDGILQLLKNKGFKIRCVTPSNGTSCEEYKTRIKNYKSYNFKNSSYRFSMIWNGKPLITDSLQQFRCIYHEMGQGNTFELVVYPNDRINEDCLDEFIALPQQEPKKYISPEGYKVAEGMTKNSWYGLQWKRVIVSNNFTYIMTCYGGNKFMHSNRPQLYFDRLKIEDL